MKAMIQLYLKQLFSRKLLLFVIGCGLFSIAARQGMSGSYELYVLHMLTDHYYLTYMMVPIYLLFLYQSLGGISEILLIRTAYFWRSFLARAVAALIHAAGFVCIQIFVFLAAGMGLKSSNHFPAALSPDNEVVYFLGSYFPVPSIAIVAVALFMSVGLFTVSLAMLAFRHFFNEKATLLVLVSLYIIMTFGIKVPSLSWIPFFSIDHYIIFHHNFLYKGMLLVTAASTLVIYCAVFWLVKHCWHCKPAFKLNWRLKGISSLYARQIYTGRNIIVMLAIILILSLWKAINASAFEGADFTDYYRMLFYGHGQSGFYLLPFIDMLIMNCAPLYLLAIFLEEEKRDRNLAITIRLRTKTSWLYAVTGAGISCIAFYVICLLGISTMLAARFGFENPEADLVIQIAVLKFLDIFAQFLFMLLLYSCTRNTTWAFLGVIAANALSILFTYIPAGISSIARSEEMGGLPFFTQFSILILSQLITWAYIRTIGRKKIFQ